VTRGCGVSVTRCREAGGAWWNGEPCGMDAVQGQRCWFHRPGLAGALGCALLTELLDPLTSRLHDGSDPPSLPEREAIERLVGVGRLGRPGSAHEFPPPEVNALQTTIRLYAVTLRLLWDVASRPGTDTSEQLATLLRRRLADLHDDLGPYLPAVIQTAMHKPYCETAGNLCPFPSQRHADDCEQPYDPDTLEPTCACPILFDWEVEERQERSEQP
jgi:hypothetical protein